MSRILAIEDPDERKKALIKEYTRSQTTFMVMAFIMGLSFGLTILSVEWYYLTILIGLIVVFIFSTFKFLQSSYKVMYSLGAYNCIEIMHKEVEALASEEEKEKCST